MPVTRSAKRALRKSLRRRARNLERKRRLKAVIKEYKKLLQEGKKEEAKKFLTQVYKVIDKSAKVNLIKKNKANRMKSKLAKKLNQS